MTGKDRTLDGVEAVIDKDLASEFLARELDADVFVMATDVDAVYEDWGTPEQRKLDRSRRKSCGSRHFAAGSMGPKVAAAAMFVEHTGERAAIGSLADIEQIVTGEAGTSVVPTADAESKEDQMSDFGVHSEVGKLRKVMVHRPDLSLQRLTPTNHDELLFDDSKHLNRTKEGGQHVLLSSNSRSSWFVGVSRWRLRSGRWTMTFRSLPTSEWTPTSLILIPPL